MQVSDLNEEEEEIPNDQMNLREIIHRARCREEIFYSFELVSCNDDKGIYEKLFSDVKECSPLFYSLTWHDTPNANCFVSLKCLPQFPKNTLLHLVARGLKKNTVVQILNRVLELDVRNLFIIRGDGPVDDGDFNYAIDLINFITEQYDNKFCIGVAGYPNKHPESSSKESDLYYLKKKIDASASFIITQIIFESSVFIDYVKDCANYGINVPIIPLIMPIISYKSFINMTKNCKLTVPQSLYNNLKILKDDEVAVQQYGIQTTIEIITDILSNNCASIFHVCTLNNAPVAVELCKKISRFEKINKKIN